MGKLLITGGTGFIGSELAKTLVDKEQDVRVLDLLPPRQPIAGVEYVVGDCRSSSVLSASLDGIDCVFHCAAYVSWLSRARRLREHNLDALQLTLEGAAARGVRRFVLVSCSSMYGTHAVPPTAESDIPRPVSLYGHVRLQMERLALSYEDRCLRVVVLRPNIVAGREKRGLLRHLMTVAERYGLLFLPSSADYPHQIIHVSDLAEACWLAYQANLAGLYHVGATARYSLRELLEQAVHRVNPECRVIMFPARVLRSLALLERLTGLSMLAPYETLGAQTGFYFEVSLAESELGFSASVSETAAWEGTIDSQTVEEELIRAEGSADC